jgi:hypothetical protein
MLNTYLQRTRLLLNDPTFAKFNDFDLVTWINIGRGQVAGEGECVRIYGILNLVASVRSYSFSAITYGAVQGISGTNNIRQLWYEIPGTAGQVLVTPREFEWFGLYNLNNPVPSSGQPTTWAQQGQGQNGTLFVDPLPDLPYVCLLDVVAAPTPLATDTDVEAIPPLWQDAVPYFAAYLALLTARDGDGANKMMELYSLFVGRARTAATPSVLPGQYSQTADPASAQRFQK